MTTTAKPLKQPHSISGERGNWLINLVVRIQPAWWPALLLFSDLLLIFAAFLLSYWVRYQLQWFRAVDPANQTDFVTYLPFSVALVAILFLSFNFSGVYRQRRDRGWLEEVYSIATATTLGVVTLIILNLIFGELSYSRLIFLYAAVFVILLLGGSRAAIYMLRGYLRARGVAVQRVVLVGAGDVGRMVMRNIAARPNLGYRLIGFLDDNPTKNSTDIGRFKALGPLENFEQVLLTYPVDEAIICLPWQSHRTVARLLHQCEQSGVRAHIVPDLFQLTKNQMRVEDLNGVPLISTREVSIAGWNLIFKRVLDLVIVSVGSLFALPIGLLIILAIRLDSSGPVIYSQTRVGKNGKPFAIYKFRSMVTDAEERRDELAALNEATGPLFKVRDDPRRTRVGRLLRRFSLDELPQLINVFRGEMSLIGPRPNLPEEVAQYKEWHHKRLSVSPGMTGLWQVSGRSDLTFDEMVLLDIYYAENWSLGMDLGILLMTGPRVLFAKGAY
ncbi:MAG: sugar transferase [Caldilineaceae bacterium]|nr:sugar transferase [Caldilineaceae bacterium]